MLTPSTVVIDWPDKPYARYDDCVPAVLPPTSARGIVIPGVWASRAKRSRWLGMSRNIASPKFVPTVAFCTSTIGELPVTTIVSSMSGMTSSTISMADMPATTVRSTRWLRKPFAVTSRRSVPGVASIAKPTGRVRDRSPGAARRCRDRDDGAGDRRPRFVPDLSGQACRGCRLIAVGIDDWPPHDA